jgi:hypothetical protein
MELAQTRTGCGAPSVWSPDGRATVLSCIGCGRIDTAQQCAGTCGEYSAEIVAATAHDRARVRRAAARARLDALTALTRRLAAHPPVDDARAAYAELQDQARQTLRELPRDGPADDRAERLAVWSCGCCGRMEAEAPCIGVCTDELLDVVRGDLHDELIAEVQALDARVGALRALVRQLAFVRPRDGSWAANLRVMQQRARTLVGADAR